MSENQVFGARHDWHFAFPDDLYGKVSSLLCSTKEEIGCVA